MTEKKYLFIKEMTNREIEYIPDGLMDDPAYQNDPMILEAIRRNGIYKQRLEYLEEHKDEMDGRIAMAILKKNFPITEGDKHIDLEKDKKWADEHYNEKDDDEIMYLYLNKIRP